MQLMDDEELKVLQRQNDGQRQTKAHNYKTGDYVRAPLSEDGQFYEAQIEDITSDGQCTVVFFRNKKRITEVCLLELLKPCIGGKKRTFNSGHSGPGASSSKRIVSDASMAAASADYKESAEQREALKRKQAKKKEKFKQLEEEREKDKSRWQQFANKAAHKKFKGTTKKSIFTTPDSVNGRVGIGTCGVGGRPMTEYQQFEKVTAKGRSNLPMPFDDDQPGGSSRRRN